jgi:hypothetical protein
MLKYSFVCCLLLFLVTGLFTGCHEKKPVLFHRLSNSESGIDFRNLIEENEEMNVLNYTYFYNGGGVAAGDINGDGLPDLLFTGNMVKNRLYLNKGNHRFEDITEKSGIAKAEGWCTGATMVDINGDGKLDIYICRSADVDPEKRANLLYINNGDNTFTEKAHEYGLDDKGYSTQASFFDYDKDGDLDVIIINHSLQQYTSGTLDHPQLRQQYNEFFATKLYRNDGGHFTDVSREAGILSNVLSFGLGVSISDFNNDGWPDIYVSNDFNEPDYLFINNRNGTFTEQAQRRMDQLSLFSMGNDAADINNDGLTDLVTLDMLPEDNLGQKLHSGAENYDKFQLLSQKGFYHQYSRNMLHLNNGDGTFSEIGQLSGISNTDWSWSALFADFDNDGYKDLFITNGYVKDYTNMDFIKFTMEEQMRQKGGEEASKTPLQYIAKMPLNPKSNYMFRNTGHLRFDNVGTQWGIDQKGISSGAVYVDLDNDGDLDLVTNNINDYAGIYINQASEQTGHHFVRLKLQGDGLNTQGVGARVVVYAGGETLMQEHFSTRGFQSCVDNTLNFGLGDHKRIDSLLVTWPDDRQHLYVNLQTDTTYLLQISDAVKNGRIAQGTDLNPEALFREESNFQYQIDSMPLVNDFTIQALLNNHLSNFGPVVVSGDLNKDGLNDQVIGGTKNSPTIVWISRKGGKPIQFELPETERLPVSAISIADVNKDGYNDLIIGNFRYEEPIRGSSVHVYINDKNGHFAEDTHSKIPVNTNIGCIKAADVNGDGYVDIFIGSRVISTEYPHAGKSVLLLNNGHGAFTQSFPLPVSDLGMVTDAAFIDITGDGKQDLVVVGEFQPIRVFVNEGNRFRDASGSYIHFPSNGWWTKILCGDFDGDGDTDLLIGNYGLNTQFSVNSREPAHLYCKDFDQNGKIDPIFAYYIQHKEYPMASLDDMADQIPFIRKRFLQYENYANATIEDLLTPGMRQGMEVLTLNELQTLYLENKSNKTFEKKSLPVEVQWSPVFAMASVDLNHDGALDLLVAGNQSRTRIKYGRYSANHGMVLVNDGKGNFRYYPAYQTGLQLQNDVRSLILDTTVSPHSLLVGMDGKRLKRYIWTGMHSVGK